MLKNLNVLLSENVECAKHFFNFYFPTMITLDPNMILVPYQQEVLLYQDIMVVILFYYFALFSKKKKKSNHCVLLNSNRRNYTKE